MPDWLVLLLSFSTIGLTGIFTVRVGKLWSDRRSATYLTDQDSRHCDSSVVGVVVDTWDAATIVLEMPPGSFRARQIATHDAPTEFLPRLQDIVPPVRATPIRRPPWVGNDH